jgi:hypothetical protein
VQPETRVTISPVRYLGQYQKALIDHMSELRNTLRSLEDGSFLERAQAASPGAVVQLQFEPSGRVEPDAVAAACNRCFLGFVRELVSFLDRMIALRRLKQEKTTLSQPITSLEDLERFIDGRLNEIYQQVARDQRLSNPAKLAEFSRLPEMPKKAVESCLALRRCLEHHGGVPTEELRLHAVRPVILAGDQEITSLPFSAAAGVAISVRIDEVVSVFPAGVRVALSEVQLYHVIFTLQQQVGPMIIAAL